MFEDRQNMTNAFFILTGIVHKIFSLNIDYISLFNNFWSFILRYKETFSIIYYVFTINKLFRFKNVAVIWNEDRWSKVRW